MRRIQKKRNCILFVSAFVVFSFTTCIPERDNPWDDKATIDPSTWAPNNLVLKTNTLNSITLSWEHNTDHIEGYVIDRKIGSGNWVDAFITINSGNKSFTDNSVLLTNTYTYRVYAFAGINKSEYTEVESTPITPPIVTTNEVTNITYNSAISGGDITNNDIIPVIVKGVVWSTSQNPTTNNNQGIVTDRTGSGAFTSKLTNLTPKTTYYLRAYATNGVGTQYGNQVSFTTKDAIIYNGYTYPIVTINGRKWFAENLRTTKYRNGSDIPNVTNNSSWASLNTPAYCWYNNDQNTYGNTYGTLYNWYAVNTGNLCPTGWHVPTEAEWYAMENFVDPTISDPNALGWRGIDGGTKLKATSGWNSGGNGTDEVGFSALPGGYRNYGDGTFVNVGNYGYWWSNTETDAESAWRRNLFIDSKNVNRFNINKRNGFSVRCIKDID